MALSNEHFQTYLNKSPYMKKDASDCSYPYSQNYYQARSYDQTNMISYPQGNMYQQGNSYMPENYDSVDPNYHKLNMNNGLMQRRTGFGMHNNNYPAASTQQPFDLYAQETLNYDGAHQNVTPGYSEDSDEERTSQGLSTGSKKIHKESFKGAKSSKKDLMLKSKTKRNPWQPEEDDQVIDLVAKYGQSWALIASLMKDRSGKQIRDRYLNKLKPDINKSEWATSEDELLMKLCKQIGHKWSRIATYLPGRTEGQVKNRFYSHIKKRMGKWNGLATSSQDPILEEESASESDDCKKEDAMNFGKMDESKILARSVKMLNCAGNYKIINATEENSRLPSINCSSINIKVGGIKEEVSPTTQLKNSITFNPMVKRSNGNDPTDVISYIGATAKDVYAPQSEEMKSPISFGASVPLPSTRASSLSHEKEFDEVYDKMASMLVKNPNNTFQKSGISFNISQGGIFNKTVESPKMPTTTAVDTKKVNQINFSGVQNKINIKIC